MPMLDTTPRIARPDDLYARLIAAHDGLSDDASLKLNAKLVLILANHIADAGILEQAIALARQSTGTDRAA